MHLKGNFVITAVGLITGLHFVLSDQECTSQDYLNCVKMADPLLTQPNLIFPDNLDDIKDLCGKWRQFVQCVNDYTARCFTEMQQEDFIKAVESPVDQVHQMCTETHYQLEYLQHAQCIQSTITRDGRCSGNYRQLVNQVLGEVEQDNLCCSHHYFHECVISEVKRLCHTMETGESATKFTRQILNKALSFLQARCHNYDHTSRECSQRMLPSNTHPGIINGSESKNIKDGGNNSPTQQQRSTNIIPSQHHPPQSPDNRHSTPAWQPGHNVDKYNQNRPQFPNNDEQREVNSRDLNNHSTYGRGIKWPVSSPQTSNGQTQIHDTNNPSVYNTWRVSSNSAMTITHTTEPWYPSVLNNRGKTSNDVDEPNQQGLANNKNNATKLIVPYMLVIVISIIVIGISK